MSRLPHLLSRAIRSPGARSLLATVAAVALTGCASLGPGGAGTRTPGVVEAERHLRRARSLERLEAEASAWHYLRAAELATSELGAPATGPGTINPRARAIYNRASAELVALLAPANGNRLILGHTSEIGGPPGESDYLVRRPVGSRASGHWEVATFNRYHVASEISGRRLRHRVGRDGWGGALVGVSKTGLEGTERDPFGPPNGRAAAVTATLEFRDDPRDAGRRAVDVRLWDPLRIDRVRVAGRDGALAADLSAPVAYSPSRSELLEGLIRMLRVDRYDANANLYMPEPYDPEKIPVILVHGLMSTPQIWLEVANEFYADPDLRRRYQFWLFSYPTGNPVPYSALRLREEMARAWRAYPRARGCVMVGHSMGGLLARMQSIDTGRALWDAVLGSRAGRLWRETSPDQLARRALVFDADPRVERLVFLCTPHRGSDLAIGPLGKLAMSLIRLPHSVVEEASRILLTPIEALAHSPRRLPTSIQGLSPDSPVLRALDSLPIRAPHHSIIGDRGRGGSPDSSDGIVPYRSAHLDSARSEKIVPAGHSAFKSRDAVEEIERLLHLHLREIGAN